jgi:hypothetical protein
MLPLADLLCLFPSCEEGTDFLESSARTVAVPFDPFWAGAALLTPTVMGTGGCDTAAGAAAVVWGFPNDCNAAENAVHSSGFKNQKL